MDPVAAAANYPVPGIRERRGIVFDKWPFRLDIAVEYQDWILVAVSFVVVSIACLPCFCGRMHNRCSRAFTKWVYTRLHVYFCFVVYIDLFIVMFSIGVLPDWTVNQYIRQTIHFVSWVLIHLQKLIVSISILMGLFLMVRFRDRLFMAAGMEHVTVIRWNWRDVFGWSARKRPVEVFIWKVEGLFSSSKKFKPNDVYVECHMGHNEPMRTRVHNNAGSSCLIRESFQLNIDESAAGTLMTLLVKDQALVASTELGRLMISTRELCGIEDQTGKRRMIFDYSEENFISLDLSPSGKIWIAIAPVDDSEPHERERLLSEEDALTC
mmetsp:Transcript_73064/g.144883  ORF Transcript_73064/g.144883 Transcript_73064/m.144883 type:complete len:324 (-) Transcript_73064:33-1004(-)